MPAQDNSTGQELASAFGGKRVLVTGHTGFKGGWLALWLSKLGAAVTGISLPADGADNLFGAARIDEVTDHRIGDIRSQENFSRAVGDLDADIVFHLAAQPIVRASYGDPVDTYATNVVGTSVVLEAARRMPSLKAVVVVTSDKCYENLEWDYGYRETDAMGGSDPYSASKACTELLVTSYRRSFFSGADAPLLASARAGNVFGGGDWAADRLFPDIVRGALAGEPVVIRNRASVRPWQHVLEPLHGYLMLGAKLLEGDADKAEGWNFGPNANGVVSVETLASEVASAWGPSGPRFMFGRNPADLHEAGVLRLDSSKANAHLGWHPRLSLTQSVAMTVDWYRAHAAGSSDMQQYSLRQIEDFEQRGRLRRVA
jgi:CDP-glucose 4,6-dehydratase